MKTKIIVLILSILVPAVSHAVFIGAGTASSANANNSQPAGDQGWSSMGVYNTGGAVYLKNGWFITAGHLGTSGGSVNYSSVDYSISKWTNITNDIGTSADIRLIQVLNPSAFTGSGSSVYTNSMSIGTGVTMIGNGRDVSSVASTGLETRYYEGTVSQMKWGQNVISGHQTGYSELGFVSDVYITTLNDGTAQALDKDSGGGVFFYDSGSDEYLLSGVIIAATRYSDGNIYARTHKTLDNSTTSFVDLSAYSEQINQAIPEPASAMLLIGVGALLGVAHRIRCMLE